MKRISILIMAVSVLSIISGCAVAHGTYNAPLTPMSVASSDDLDNATVIFYRPDSFIGTLDAGDRVIIIDYDKERTYYERSEIMIASKQGYTISKLAPGIHTFSHPRGAKGTQTALLNSGETYFLAVSYMWSPLGGMVSPIVNLKFVEEKDFLEAAEDKSLFVITKGYDINNPSVEYEIIE